MEKFEPLFLTGFLGLKEFLPSKGSDCLMGLNPSETGISITQISEARHEHPLERRLLPIINLSPVFASLQAGAVACPTICLFFSFAIRHSPSVCLAIFFSHALLVSMGLRVLGTIPSLFSHRV